MDAHEPLTPLDREKFATLLNERWDGQKECPICKKNEWLLSDYLAEVRTFTKGSILLGAPVYPVVVVTCRVCGNTLLFNAIVLGLVKPPPPEQKTTVETARAQMEGGG